MATDKFVVINPKIYDRDDLKKLLEDYCGYEKRSMESSARTLLECSTKKVFFLVWAEANLPSEVAGFIHSGALAVAENGDGEVVITDKNMEQILEMIPRMPRELGIAFVRLLVEKTLGTLTR